MNIENELIALLPKLSNIQENTFKLCRKHNCGKCPLNFNIKEDYEPYNKCSNICVDTILGQLLDCIEKMKDEKDE